MESETFGLKFPAEFEISRMDIIKSINIQKNNIKSRAFSSLGTTSLETLFSTSRECRMKKNKPRKKALKKRKDGSWTKRKKPGSIHNKKKVVAQRLAIQPADNLELQF